MIVHTVFIENKISHQVNNKQSYYVRQEFAVVFCVRSFLGCSKFDEPENRISHQENNKQSYYLWQEFAVVFRV